MTDLITIPIKCFHEYQIEVERISNEWRKENDHPIVVPWFRGQRRSLEKPIPSIFRKNDNGKQYDEFWITNRFINQAPAFAQTPNVKEEDKWLFLMQHYKSPTRLLDWTESSLIALFFALQDDYKKNDDIPAVWMLNPFKLNESSVESFAIPPSENVYFYFRLAFEQFHGTSQEIKNKKEDYKRKIHCLFPNLNYNQLLEYPIAVQTTYINERMKAQKCAFTIHGMQEIDFETLINDQLEKMKNDFIKMTIECDIQKLKDQLRLMGITNSVVFPDLEGLSLDLKSYLIKD